MQNSTPFEKYSRGTDDVTNSSSLVSGDEFAEFSESMLWTLFADICQRLQVSSASIKAATSSLVDNSIIWDQSAQHEFVQSIDKTIDHISSISVVMTLAMKSANGRLTLILEPSSIQEILSRLANVLTRDMPKLSVTLDLPVGGKAALVDYDYLRIALRLLLEALMTSSSVPLEHLHIRAVEAEQWQIYFEGEFAGAATDLIARLSTVPPQVLLAEGIQPEAMLKAHTTSHILQQQHIGFSSVETAASPGIFMLSIPFAGA
jgi:hypothetical protein